jgi:hypothetical protein
VNLPAFYSRANDAHPMDEDLKSYAVPSERMPPENKVSCALESVDVMRRCLALQTAKNNALLVELGRRPVNNWRYSKFELDLAPVQTLLVRRDGGGGVNVSMES